MHADWTRTDLQVTARGGALTNAFDAANLDASRTLPPDRRESSSDALWRNLAYLLERLVPAAEEAGVKLAMHPDDPPMPSLLGAAQIMHNAACYDRLFELNPSPANGMCFCQGTFAEMGTPDMPAMIRRFGSRIHYVHFRDVRGTMPKFVETFHDEGQTDMHAAMQAYRAIGFTGPARPDHVPTLADEDGDGSGYSMLGRLFAVGYMRGLIHSVYGRTSS
jgi:mannonate dehydratase